MLGAFKLNTLSMAMASAPAQVLAYGGIESIATVGGTSYKFHKFTQAGEFPTLGVGNSGTVDLLLVGGGGAGGTTNAIAYNQRCGGGGGGEVKVVTGVSVTPQGYAITVASGGSPGGKNNGSASSAMGQSAAGGGAGGMGATNTTDMAGVNGVTAGGGGGCYNSYFGSSGSRGTGTYNGSTGTSTRGGGGGGAGAASTAGAGGAGIQLNFTGTNTYYAGGGGGGGSSPGSGGLGGGGNGGNLTTGATGAANTGGGGGGAADDTGNNRNGGGGGTGLVIVRYPFTPGSAVTSIQTVTSKTSLSSSSGNFVLPTGGDLAPNYYNVQAGDLAVFFDMSTTTTDVVPSGWATITKAISAGMRQNISYKVLTASDLGSTITGMAGVNRKVMVIYRPNTAFNTINFTVTGSQATTAVPTNQSLVGEAGPMIAFACYSATVSGVTTRGWSVGSPTEYLSNSTQSIYVKALITNSGTPTTTTISMSDNGTNALQSFRMKFS